MNIEAYFCRGSIGLNVLYWNAQKQRESKMAEVSRTEMYGRIRVEIKYLIF